MKNKFISKLSVALVCMLLGFMIAYQFKLIKQKSDNINSTNTSDITAEIEQLNKQKDQLQESVNELQNKISDYEEASATRSDESQKLLEELKDSRMLLGYLDAQGEGLIVTLTPAVTPSSGFLGDTGNLNRINDEDLVYVVNELRFAGAEAISINDMRITSFTGIRNAGNYILINDEKISPSEKVVIKAIGDKELLYASLILKETFSSFSGIFDAKIERNDDIEINKYIGTYQLKYAKQVED
ncbi:MAG: DUF881 domain-containing protein [Clostridiaceae bacterium]